MKLRLFTIVFVASCLLSSCVKDEIPTDVIEYIDEYGINHGPGIKIGPHVWAPVNCGYHATDYKYGKLYQWGRKYGQGFGDDASVPVLEDGGVSLEVGNDKSKENVYYGWVKGVCSYHRGVILSLRGSIPLALLYH